MSAKLWGNITNQDIDDLKEFSLAIKADDHNKMLLIAKKMQKRKSNLADGALHISLWNKYSQIEDDKVAPQNIAFSDIARFVNDNQFFPNLDDLKKNTEKVAIANQISYQFSKQYFNQFQASEVNAKLYLLKSKIAHSHMKKKPHLPKAYLESEINKLITDIWVNEVFDNQTQEERFLAQYGNKLTEENHIERIETLLWNKHKKAAKRIFYLINKDYKKLFNAIIKIDRNPKYIKNIILSVPRSLRGNELLAYKIVRWHKKQDKDIEDIADMLLKVPSKTKHPEKWWPLKKLYARELLKTKDYDEAYKLFAKSGLKAKGAKFADAQWSAGWVALRFLDEPEIAYDHFYNLYLNVSYPISISRAAYWLGMASMAMGKEEKAIDWYKVAIRYPTYFYGQLALHKHKLLNGEDTQNNIILPDNPDFSNNDINAIAKENSVKIAYILYLVGYKKTASKIFEYAIADAKTNGQIAVVMEVVNEMKDKELDVKISKAAAKRNVFFIKDKFQIIKKISNDDHSPLVHAIIKQESGFAKSAYSSAGAIGFMQIMPKTAQLICKELGIRYSRYKLANNINYNIQLGSYYIKKLVEEFEGSEILAIASYNAGPHNAKRWIEEFYDPRKTDNLDEIIDWIELITYSETRNYVQRIMENLIVYKYLMSRTDYDIIK